MVKSNDELDKAEQQRLEQKLDKIFDGISVLNEKFFILNTAFSERDKLYTANNQQLIARVAKLESTLEWMNKLVVGAVITALLGFITTIKF